MSYGSSSAGNQYQRKKITSWVMGYQCKGQYRVFKNGTALPRSIESVDLIVPVRKGVQLPIGVDVRKKFTVTSRYAGQGPEDRLLVTVPRDKLDKFEVSNAHVQDIVAPPRGPRAVTQYDKEIDVIRRALKKMVPTLSVQRGSGTAYSWIEVHNKNHNIFTDQENKALQDFDLTPGGNAVDISPDDRSFYVAKAKKLLGE